MKNKLLKIALILILCITSVNAYGIGSTAAVIVAGAKIKSRKIDIEKKYPRSKCPICKGKGIIKSGDTIVVVDIECPYCVPDNKSGDLPQEEALEHPPIILSPQKESEDQCKEGKCPIKPAPSKPAKPTTIYRR
jgi:hypothetical protein